MAKFECPHCRTKISFKEVFQFKKDHKTKCKSCEATLSPKKNIHWHLSFLFGFLSFAIPGRIYLIFHDNFFIAALAGLFFAIITILLIAFYTYKTTDFIKE